MEAITATAAAMNPSSQKGITGTAVGVIDGGGGEVRTLKVIESAAYVNE